MSETGKQMIAAAEEALAIAKGDKPAAAIWHNGHRYVPADDHITPVGYVCQGTIAWLKAGMEPGSVVWLPGRHPDDAEPLYAAPPKMWIQFPPYDAPRLICEALTEVFGEKCPDFDEGCATCAIWKEWDRLYNATQSQSPTPPDLLDTGREG